jgi:hypothetical protein
MKDLMKLSWLLFVALCLQTCIEEEPSRSKGNVQFTFEARKMPGAEGGRTRSEEFPAGSYLIVSITDKDGEAVLTREAVALYQVGNQFISDVVVLETGEYSLTDFWVADPNRVMLYAAPKAASPLSLLVDRPLPFSFVVTENFVLEEPVQVVSVGENTPEDFGYPSFRIEVATRFQLAVFIPGDDGPTLTWAQSMILDANQDTLSIQWLEELTNTLYLKGNPNDTFELVVIKDGYARYSRKFTYAGLARELKAKPLKVSLQPALTFVANLNYSDGPVYYVFRQNTDSVNLSIDWGDGTSGHALEHVYEKGRSYYVSITGDLTAIKELSFFYDDSRFNQIDLRHLTELRHFDSGYMGMGPVVLDFNDNKKLESIGASYMPDLAHILLPPGLKLRYVNISGPNKLTSSDVDHIISYTYGSAVSNNLRDGFFGILNILTSELTGPPSSASLEKLETLRDDYGWTLYPDHF